LSSVVSWAASRFDTVMLTIPDILNQQPEPKDVSHPAAKTQEVLSTPLKQQTTAHYAYEDEVFAFLCNNRSLLGIDRVYRFKNQSMDGELVLQDGAAVPIEIKFRMNWLKACQANWQFARFLKLTGRTSCKTGIVFFEEYSGDWDITAKSRSIPNGWIRWYKEHYQLQGLDFHLVRLRNGEIQTYSDVSAP
jgi:hypothetical protein